MSINKLSTIIILALLSIQTLYPMNIVGRGASFPSTVYQEWAKAYHVATGKQVKYIPTGSGDGIISIKKPKVSFGGSDKPLKPWRLKRYNLMMFPTIIGSIVLAYNLPHHQKGILKLNEKAIGKIFSGEAKYWDNPSIKRTNKDLNLPHKPITLIVRKKGSGTTFNFTYYLRKIDYKHFPKAKKVFDWQGKVKKVKGNKGIAQTITNTPYSIGYIEYSYKEKYHLDVATIKNREDRWVTPSLEACKKGAYYGKMHKENDFFSIISYPKGEESYPNIATSFILLPKENKKLNKEIIDFYTWVFRHGEKIASRHGYAFLPPSTIEEIKFYWEEKIL